MPPFSFEAVYYTIAYTIGDEDIMKFYTSVTRIGDSIAYRGYLNGNRVEKKIKFSPTLYIRTSKPSKWKTLEGQPVESIEFDTMSDANDFIKQYADVPNFDIYGMNNFVPQFIQKEFPREIEFNKSDVNVITIDIEVASDEGFPEPESANHEVISIALKSSKSPDYIVWGLFDYDTSKSIVGEENVRYVKCAGETDLLLKFMSYWQGKDTSPDVVTGWNVRLFDIPYLVNRITKVLGSDSAKKMSPWQVIREKSFGMNGKQQQAYDLLGIEQLDGWDLFQKFGTLIYGTQESYKLDHIAHVVLGEQKLSYEEFGSLHSLYKHDYQKFIDYNIKDVQLVERIDEKVDLVNLAMTIGYKAGSNYTDSFGTTSLWDNYIYRELCKRNVVVPPKVNKEKDDLAGGYVKSPKIGRHKWVVSFDLNSLYPHLIMQYNMSPETIMDVRTPGVNVESCLNKKLPERACDESVMAANGVHFRRDFRGVIPGIIDGLYDERKAIKKEMLLEQQKVEEEGDSPQSQRIIATLDSQQMAIKIMMNSLYGAMGNRWFRYYDNRVAEAITLSGQLSILWAEKAVNAFINKILNSDKDHVIAIDTDSLYIDFNPLVKMLNAENKSELEIVQLLDKVCSEQFEPMLERSYEELSRYMGAYQNRMVMKREVIANAAIWTAKKRYILNVLNNEGVQYKKPKLKIMGIEAVKSSTPASCRDALKELFKVMIVGSEEDVQSAIKMFKEHFKKLPPHEVAFPRGARKVGDWKDRKKIYKKGCPIHVRGCLLYNHHLKEQGLTKRYVEIKDGEKIKFLYLKKPNGIKENVIAFPDYLPEELHLHKYVDYETQFEKAFLAVVRPVLEAVGWREEDEVNLEDFFG